MENKIEERTAAYLSLFEQLRRKVSDERLAGILLQEIAKDLRMDRIEAKNGNGSENPATEKQIAYLKSLGVQARLGLTKREASLLIDQHNGVKSAHVE
jgi:hypothetical protein